MENRTKFYAILAAAVLFSLPAAAEQIPMNMAQMQAMDKITGRVSMIEVPVGGEIKFGSFSIVVRSCQTSSEEEIPENSAFVDVTDKSFDQNEFNIFKGWMFSSSPAVNAVQHPIYDVWLIKCFNGEPKKDMMLSADELSRRDNLPRLEDVQKEQQKLEENSFEKVNDNIQFKDTMYKEEQPKPQNDASTTPKEDGEPENLLNIRESYEEPEEETITLPAEDFSQAVNQEINSLQNQNDDSAVKEKPQSTPTIEENQEESPAENTIPAPQNPPLADSLDDDLAAAIDAELLQTTN